MPESVLLKYGSNNTKMISVENSMHKHYTTKCRGCLDHLITNYSLVTG